MPTSGTIDSTVVSLRSLDTTQTARRGSGGPSSNGAIQPDDREIFKALHDCMKDVGKFRQYIYYLGTSCDTTKLRNKIQKMKLRINRSFSQLQGIIENGAAATGSIKSEIAIRRFQKCIYFTIASLNYYEDLLHKFTMLLAYFPLATADRTNVVTLGFEDSTINADEASVEHYDNEDNETNRYIESLNSIQHVQTLREEIEHIDIYQLWHNSTTYSKDFVENMHQYTVDLINENEIRRPSKRRRFIRFYGFNHEPGSSVAICHRRFNRRDFFCIVTVIFCVLIIVGIVVFLITATRRVHHDH